MPFETLGSSIQQSVEFLKGMAEKSTDGKEQECLLFCAKGLTILTEQRQEYQHYVQTARPFLTSFRRSIQESGFLDGTKQEQALENIRDIAFSLLEDSIIFIREKTLRSIGHLAPTEDEKDLLNYFVHSGEWQFGDGTLASDYYYVQLPAAVLQNNTETVVNA